MEFDWREAGRNEVDLLFVETRSGVLVAEATRYTAEVGDLVEIETQNGTVLGVVDKKMNCVRCDNEWACVARLAAINPASAVYKNVWSRPEEED